MVTIRAHDLSVAHGGTTVLAGIDLAFAPGSLVGLVGPNGAGKSTLLRALLALVPPAHGRVTIDDVDVAALRPADLARRAAYLPQGQQLHWPLSVARLVALGRLPHMGPLSRLSAIDAAAIDAALAETGTTALRDRTATELSGGERTRVMLARLLATGAPALLADEPLAALDPAYQIEVLALLAQRARAGDTVIVALHELALAARFCDRIVVLEGGRILADGSPAEALDDAVLARAFGISAWRGTAAGIPLIVPTASLRGTLGAAPSP